MDSLDDLKKKARAATAGDWHCAEDGGDSFVYAYTSQRPKNIGPVTLIKTLPIILSRQMLHENAVFVSAANPSTVLELIERLERAEQHVEAANRVGKAVFESKQYWADRAVNAEAELAAFKAEARTFVERVRRGEIRSKRTYEAFVKLLGEEGAPEPACPNSLHDQIADIEQTRVRSAEDAVIANLNRKLGGQGGAQ